MNDSNGMLEGLRLINDEPADELLFGFDNLACLLCDTITSTNAVTPFTIAIHGTWGSGKTSLINKVYNNVCKIIEERANWKILKFNAWEYERTDVVAALFQRIRSEYRDGEKEAFKALSSFIIDGVLRRTAGLSIKEAKEHFEQVIDQIPNIRKNLEEIIGGGRLIILVDDLDRCDIGNVLDMLEAIKMFLAVENVIFVVAVDLEKIARAWELRYSSKLGIIEGKEHVEKIFQVKLSLPPKKKKDIDEFLSNIASDFLNKANRKDLITETCEHNPRKIKRLLNLVYFVLQGLDKREGNEEVVNWVIGWCVLVLYFSDLAKAIKFDPKLLFYLAYVCSEYKVLPIQLSNITEDVVKQKLQANFSADELGEEIRHITVLIRKMSETNDTPTFEFLLKLTAHNWQRGRPPTDPTKKKDVMLSFSVVAESNAFVGA